MSDVTIPDNSLVEPGQSFTKTWRVKNCGTAAWGTGATLRFMEGDQMGAPDSVSVADVAPGESIDISVEMVAPTESGTYRGDWRLQLADGTWLGNPVWVVVLVASPDPIPAGQEGSSVEIEGKTWTLPCGSPIPPGAVCICNCVTVPLLGEPGEVPPGETGINLTGPSGETRTMPCGSPIPPGWTCVCNCVSVPAPCTCVGHTHTIHYWYPC